METNNTKNKSELFDYIFNCFWVLPFAVFVYSISSMFLNNFFAIFLSIIVFSTLLRIEKLADDLKEAQKKIKELEEKNNKN